MPKSTNQKLKLLYILKILSEQTDEAHYMSTGDLIEELAKYGIRAERKSIYDDLNQLTDFGYDIIHVKSRINGGYYLAGRDFELAELKLLVEVVQSSKFLTQKKSKELIGKIEKLASKWDARQLQRQVYVANRIKTANESIYYIVDDIHKAMQNNEQISFQYLEWNLERQLVPRKGGKRYQISPWALTCKDENYYLIAHDAAEDKIKHFRVDKMGDIQILSDVKREGNALFETVTLLLENQLIGVVMDRFGKEATIRKRDETHFSARVTVAVSGQFYGWLTGLGQGACLIAPSDIVEQYRQYLRDIAENYQ